MNVFLVLYSAFLMLVYSAVGPQALCLAWLFNLVMFSFIAGLQGIQRRCPNSP